MINVNVEVNCKFWSKKITNPKKYFKPKLKKIYSVIKFFRKKNITFTILLTSSNNMKKLNQEVLMCVLGLDNSGKTTILKALSREDIQYVMLLIR